MATIPSHPFYIGERDDTALVTRSWEGRDAPKRNQNIFAAEARVTMGRSKKDAQVNAKRKGAMEVAKVATEKVKKDADKHKEA